MLNSRTQLELLAPAKNAEFGIEAITHGADAIYIGGPAFGARANSGSTITDIEQLTRYAHRYNARVLVALNTLLRDEELEEARTLIWRIYNAGADALIVQDMGVLELELDLPRSSCMPAPRRIFAPPKKHASSKKLVFLSWCWHANFRWLNFTKLPKALQPPSNFSCMDRCASATAACAI